MPFQRAEPLIHPSGGAAPADNVAAHGSDAAIRLVFVDFDRSAELAPHSLPRIRIQAITQVGKASVEIARERPDLVLVHHSVLLSIVREITVDAPAGSRQGDQQQVADGTAVACVALVGETMRIALARFRGQDRQLPILVVVPAGERPETIINAIRAGATDVVSEAAAPDGLRNKIIVATQRRQLQKRPSVRIHDPAASPASQNAATGGSAIVASADAMIEVICDVARVADARFPILIHGEPGTGKSLIALALHRHGPRAAEPPGVIDCGQLPPDLVDHNLFEKSERSVDLHREHHGKTLIIENLDHASGPTQRRLLNAVRRRSRLPSDSAADSPRLIMTCSSTIDPVCQRRAISAADSSSVGLIDELFFELSGHAIELPPLRSRGQDIAMLIDHFVRSLTGTQPVDETDGEHRITQEAKNLLLAYHWPGNVAQLRSVVLSELRLGDGAIVLSDRLARRVGRLPASQTADVITQQPTAKQPEAAGSGALEPGSQRQPRLSELSLSQTWSSAVEQLLRDDSRVDDNASLYSEAIEAVETGLITAVLEKTDGNLAQSARLLGITRVSLRRKIHALGLQIPGREPIQ